MERCFAHPGFDGANDRTTETAAHGARAIPNSEICPNGHTLSPAADNAPSAKRLHTRAARPGHPTRPTMNDGALALALIAIAVLGWAYALAMAMELKRVRKQLDLADDNDARDPSTGRYVGRT